MFAWVYCLTRSAVASPEFGVAVWTAEAGAVVNVLVGHEPLQRIDSLQARCTGLPHRQTEVLHTHKHDFPPFLVTYGHQQWLLSPSTLPKATLLKSKNKNKEVEISVGCTGVWGVNVCCEGSPWESLTGTSLSDWRTQECRVLSLREQNKKKNLKKRKAVMQNQH